MLSDISICSNHLAGKEGTGCFTLFAFLASCDCLFLTVLWVGLQCVNVSFPGHTHLLFKAHAVYTHRIGGIRKRF